MITIDDIEYTEDDLDDVQKIHVNRINALRSELSATEMRAQELNVLISTYARSIKDSLVEAVTKADE